MAETLLGIVADRSERAVVRTTAASMLVKLAAERAQSVVDDVSQEDDA